MSRIIAGQAGGRSIKVPKQVTRPTSDLSLIHISEPTRLL